MTQQLDTASSRDRAVLAAVGDLRLVSGRQLQRLYFSGPLASSQNDRIARRCLQRLTDRGLLWRAERRVGGLRAGSSSYIFALTAAGLRAIGRPPRRQQGQPSLTFLEHQLAVAEVYVHLHEALHGGALAALSIETEPTCWRSLDDGSSGVLKPDLFVVASTADEDRLAFIEVDNGTEHAAALDRKTALYRGHWQSGREQRQQGVFPIVLWQATSPARREELKRLLARDEARSLHRVVSGGGLIRQLTGDRND